MTMKMNNFRVQVLLSIQRALWDMVTPNLRGVAVRHHSSLIEVRFIYESMGEDEQMLAEEVGTYVIADFSPPTDIRIRAIAAQSDLPRSLEAGEEWVYLRREKQP